MCGEKEKLPKLWLHQADWCQDFLRYKINCLDCAVFVNVQS